MTLLRAPQAGASGARSIEFVRVDDEPAVFRNPVVERPGSAVGSPRLPVNPTASRGAGRRVYPFDQPPTDAESAQALDGVQILQVADIVDPGRAAVHEEVREPDELADLLGDQRMDRIGRAEESFPRLGGDGLGQSRRTASAVERVIAVPERVPLQVVRAADGPDEERLSHVRPTPVSCVAAGTPGACATTIGFAAAPRARLGSLTAEHKRFEQFPVVFEGSRGQTGDLALIVTAAQQDRVAVKRLRLEPGDLRR